MGPPWANILSWNGSSSIWVQIWTGHMSIYIFFCRYCMLSIKGVTITKWTPPHRQNASHSLCVCVCFPFGNSYIFDGKHAVSMGKNEHAEGEKRESCVYFFVKKPVFGLANEQWLLNTTMKSFSVYFAKCHLEFLVPSTCHLSFLSIPPQLKLHGCNVCLLHRNKNYQIDLTYIFHIQKTRTTPVCQFTSPNPNPAKPFPSHNLLLPEIIGPQNSKSCIDQLHRGQSGTIASPLIPSLIYIHIHVWCSRN